MSGLTDTPLATSSSSTHTYIPDSGSGPDSESSPVNISFTQRFTITKSRTSGQFIATLPDGVTYNFRATKGSRDITNDIYENSEWLQIAEKASELFTNAAGKPMKTGNIAIDGIGDIKNPKLKNNVHFDATVTYQDEAAHELKRKTFQTTNEVALNSLETLGDAFRLEPAVTINARPSPTPVTTPSPYATPAAPPAATPATAPVPEYEDVVNDDRKKACEGRKREPVHSRDRDEAPLAARPSAIYALADQLSKMENHGRTQFNGKTHAAIVAKLRNTISQDLKNNVNEWKPDLNIFINAVKGIENDAKLDDHTLSTVGLTRTKLNQILNKTPDALTEVEKEKLIKLYAEYIHNGGEKLDDLFFKVFIASYHHGDNAPDFQVVVIEGDGTTTARALSYPRGIPIDARRCVFVYRNTTNKQYESYKRTGIGVPFDLNNPTDDKYLHINPTSTTTQRLKTPTPATAAPIVIAAAPATAEPIAPAAPIVIAAAPATAAPVAAAITTLNIDSSGRCKDISIAYQILRKLNPDLPDARLKASDELVVVANRLRSEAARLMKEEPNLNEFLSEIWSSVNNIPAFAPYAAGGISAEVRESSKTSVKQLLGPVGAEEKFNAINALAARNYSTYSDAEKSTIRNFYADYIIQQPNPPATTQKGMYFNYLDNGFLCMLPKVQIAGFEPIKLAIIKDNKINATIESIEAPTALNSTNWIFINYTGNHYEAVETNNVETLARLELMIREDKESILTDFLSILRPNTSEEIIKTRLNELKHRYPEAYTALARIMWKIDHDVWKRNSHPVNERPLEPGKPVSGTVELVNGKTIRSPDTDTILDVEVYGNWKLLEYMTPYVLREALVSPQFSRENIKAAMLAIPAI